MRSIESLTATEPVYAPMRLTGRCADGAERGGGRLNHAVEQFGDRPHGSAPGGIAVRALCGATYGRRSAGWAAPSGAGAVTCSRCLRKLPALGLNSRCEPAAPPAGRPMATQGRARVENGRAWRFGGPPPTADELCRLLVRWELSQMRAAELACVDERSVRRWCRGERQIPFATLYTIAARGAGEWISPETWRETLRP